MFSRDQFSFLMRDREGQPANWFSSGRRYAGRVTEDERLFIAIEKGTSAAALTPEEKLLIRSFCYSWLFDDGKNLAAVIVNGVDLPTAVTYVSRIGSVRRQTAELIDHARLAFEVVALLEETTAQIAGGFSPPSLTKQVGGFVADVTADWVIDKAILQNINQRYGEPNSACPPAQFNAETVLAFLRLCRLRQIVEQLDFIEPIQNALNRRLSQNIFALFAANSRQIEGLLICGSAETSAALAANAALAIGLVDLPAVDGLIDQLRMNIQSLECAARKQESSQTLHTLEKNLTEDARILGARIQRQLVSATTTEVVELATLPVASTIKLLALTSKGVGRLSGDGHFKTVLDGLETALRQTASLVDGTSEAVGVLIRGGLSTEEWARKLVNKVWQRKQ